MCEQTDDVSSYRICYGLKNVSPHRGNSGFELICSRTVTNINETDRLRKLYNRFLLKEDKQSKKSDCPDLVDDACSDLSVSQNSISLLSENELRYRLTTCREIARNQELDNAYFRPAHKYDTIAARHMRTYKEFPLYLGFLFLLSVPAFGQGLDSTQLTVERVFGSAEFFPEFGKQIKWHEGSAGYTTLEPSESMEGGTNIVLHDPASGASEVLVSAEHLVPEGAEKPLSIHGYSWSADQQQVLIFTNSKRVWRANTRGDYWVLNKKEGTIKQLGKNTPASSLMFAKFSPDGTRAAYVSKHNIFVEDLTTGAVEQITHDGSETLINGTFDWAYEEEFFLRDGFRWSPDGNRLAFWQLDASGVRDFLMINNTDSLYSFVVPVQYPKAGETNSACRVATVDLKTKDITWFEPSDDLRNHYIARMEWTPDAKEIMIQHLNRKQNRLEVILGDAASGNMRTVMVDEDEAWIDVRDPAQRWLDDGKAFLWINEVDGWRHAYRVARSDGKRQLLTVGEYDIKEALGVDEKNGWLYFEASPDNATQNYLYRVSMDGKGKLERITPTNQPGAHQYTISKDAQHALHSYSSFGTPSITDVVRLPDHRVLEVQVENKALKEKLAGINKGAHRFFRVNIGNGVELDGYEMRPPDFDNNLQYPVLFHVYGEPWSQTVVDRWGGNNYLWHLMLAQQGYIVISIDNRGTPALRGRAWRKVVYGAIGELASADQAAAAVEISKWPYVDPDRVGIWGWSGGGSMTLNALFRYPDLYSTGISVAPVPDQRYYDSIYQERYMGLPAENPDGYRRGSPISFAHQLEGNLLLIHGTGDDNVHYQGTEALINKMIEHQKQFELMSYPNRSHGIWEGKGTRQHLYTLMTEYLNRKLKPENSLIQ